MKSFTLFDSEYEMSARSHDFLTQYLSRVDRYIKKHSLNTDYSDDLKIRIAEKLDTLGNPIEDKDIISLVNDLGEPEDIFADSIQSETLLAQEDDKVSTGILSRKKKFIFGVALRLSEDLHIPVLYVRIAFILFVLVGGSGILAYLALAILLPGIFWNDKKPEDSSSVFVILFRKIFRIILIIFLLSVAAVFFFTGIGGMVGALSLWSPLIIDNQDILYMTTPLFRIASLIGCLAMIIIGLGLGAYAFGKPIFGRYSWLTLTLALVLSGIVGASTVMNFAMSFDKNFGHETSHIQTFTAPIASGTLDLDTFDRGRSHIFIGKPIWSDPIYVYEVGGTGVTVTVETKIRGQNESALTSRMRLLNPYDIRMEGERLVIRSPEVSFREVVPLSFVTRTVKITVPRGVRITEGGNPTLMNSYRTRLEDYTPGRRECQYSQYIWSDKRGAYLCDPRGYAPDILDAAMEQYTRTAFLNKDFTPIATGTTIIASGTYTVYPSAWDSDYEVAPMQVRVSLGEEGEFYVEKLGTGTVQK